MKKNSTLCLLLLIVTVTSLIASLLHAPKVSAAQYASCGNATNEAWLTNFKNTITTDWGTTDVDPTVAGNVAVAYKDLQGQNRINIYSKATLGGTRTLAIDNGTITMAANGGSYVYEYKLYSSGNAVLEGRYAATVIRQTVCIQGHIGLGTALPAGTTYSKFFQYTNATPSNLNGATYLLADGTEPPPPAAPVLSGQAGNAQNVLNWTAPAGATSYKLYNQLNNEQLYSGTALTFTHTPLTNGTNYSYIVKAENANGASVASNTVTLTPAPPPPPPPPVPQDITPRDAKLVGLGVALYTAVQFLKYFVWKHGHDS
jgi:hypothetical protein